MIKKCRRICGCIQHANKVVNGRKPSLIGQMALPRLAAMKVRNLASGGTMNTVLFLIQEDNLTIHLPTTRILENIKVCIIFNMDWKFIEN